MLEAGEFVLHKQLAPFQRNDLEIVDRWMSVGFGYFRFQGAMQSLQFFNMRVYGHIRNSPWPVAERASEGGSNQRAEHPNGSLPRQDTVKGVLGYREAAGREFVRSVAYGTHPRLYSRLMLP